MNPASKYLRDGQKRKQKELEAEKEALFDMAVGGKFDIEKAF